MKRRLPSLNALRAFEAYARHGRLVDAADELCVTHGAVSRQIKRLEDELGVRLLVREHGITHLTKEGERYAGALHKLFDDLERSTPRHDVVHQMRRLQLLCPGTFSTKWLVPRLAKFSALYREIDLEVVDSSGPWSPSPSGPNAAIRIASYEGIAEAEIDAGVIMERYHGPVVSPTLAGSALSEDALLDLPRLFTRSTYREWPDWAAASGRTLPRATRELGFDRSFHMVEAATSGLGVAIADWAMVLPELESGRLVAPLGFAHAHTPYVLLWAKGDTNGDVRALLEWLCEEASHSSAPEALSSSTPASRSASPQHPKSARRSAEA
jgi:LysR family glycine cleavage system transcriptional activator